MGLFKCWLNEWVVGIADRERKSKSADKITAAHISPITPTTAAFYLQLTEFTMIYS